MKKLSIMFTVAIAMLFVSNPAFAEGATVTADGTAGDAGWVAVGAGLAIGLGLTLIHLISIPVTNTSVNPARSTSQALFAGGDYTGQLWLFWVAPIVGAILAGMVYKYLSPEE